MELKELELKYQELGKEIERLKQEQNTKIKKRWRAEYQGWYYYISNNGYITPEREDFHLIDDYRYNTGNYYQTREEAEKARNKQLLLQRYSDFIYEITEDPIDWSNNSKNKYYLRYGGNDIEKGCNWYKAQGILYTTNENLLELAKERFTDDELKIIIGVDE